MAVSCWSCIPCLRTPKSFSRVSDVLLPDAIAIPAPAASEACWKEADLHEIGCGTWLRCTSVADGAEVEGACVFEACDSHIVIDYKQLDELVIAHGPPEHHDGYTMVPIKPTGAVELQLFEIERLKTGTVLRCARVARGSECTGAQVFESPQSYDVVGIRQLNDVVVASGPPEDHEGFTMVPIKPHGAVELQLFDIQRVMPGTRLRCARLADGDNGEGVHVFRALHSYDVVDFKQLGDAVIANGCVENHEGYVMVPIKPDGFVELKLFEIENVAPGTLLRCVCDEGEGVHVFESPDSHSVIDCKHLDDVVVAKGLPEDHDGFTMVPIKPEGAVELQLFQVEKVLRGTQLRCVHLVAGGENEGVPIFESFFSDAIIGHKQFDELVVADGMPSVDNYGRVCVPIQPVGVVQLKFCRIENVFSAGS